MNFLQKKIWIVWSKLRFLRLPQERRGRLEVDQDGRHITFLLVSLYEAGYGVQVVNSPWVFRELTCLRESAPMPFIIGGKERECGISITDKSDFDHRGHREHREVRRIQLDYDYFSGLTSDLQSRVSHGGAAIAEVSGKQGNHTLADGRLLVRLPQGNPKGEMSGSERVKTHEITRNEEAGLRLVSQAGAAFSNPSTSELARDSENISLTRSASGPASALRADEDRRSEIVVGAIRRDGGNQFADSAGFLDVQSQTGLQMDKQKAHAIRSANESTASGENSSFASISAIGGKSSGFLDSGRSWLDSAHLADAGYSRSEWSGAFEGPSSSSLVCGAARTLPAQASGVPASDSSFRVVREFRGVKSGDSEQVPCPVSLPEALRMPYFMHPSVYHRGLHKRLSLGTALDSTAEQRRRFRIGFFGTHDREFYTAHYHFPGMNRFEILEVFLKRFGDRLAQVSGAPEYWSDSEIVVAMDERGGDRQGKSFLSQDHYFEALRECDFVLSPPGWCMPVSHNLIEAMFCGAIPITNAGAFMAEPLEDGRDCLGFFGEADLVTAIEKALSMSDQEIEKMRGAVWKFYDKTLNPRVFGGIIGEARVDRVLVNAEEKSVPWGRELESGVGEFMAKFC